VPQEGKLGKEGREAKKRGRTSVSQNSAKRRGNRWKKKNSLTNAGLISLGSGEEEKTTGPLGTRSQFCLPGC